MGILSWILLGLVAGALGKWLHPGKDPGGWIATLLIGIVGAIVGGYISSAVGLGTTTGFNLWSILIATLGAVICLWAYRKFA